MSGLKTACSEDLPSCAETGLSAKLHACFYDQSYGARMAKIIDTGA